MADFNPQIQNQTENQPQSSIQSQASAKPAQGFIGNLKAKWQARVEANKAKSIIAKEQNSSQLSKEISSTLIENLPKNSSGESDYTKISITDKKKIIEAEKIFQQGIATIRDLI